MEEPRHPFSPQKGKQALVIIDVQDSFIKVMKAEVFSQVIKNIKLLIALAEKLNLPIILTEQYPKGLGKTVTQIQQSIKSYQPIEKLSFSSIGDDGFKARLKELKSTTAIILSGIETHVCILQTALDLLASGYKVYVAADATCSQRKLDWEMGLRVMDKADAIITTTEALIFQLLSKAGTEEFKFMSRLLKQTSPS